MNNEPASDAEEKLQGLPCHSPFVASLKTHTLNPWHTSYRFRDFLEAIFADFFFVDSTVNSVA